MSRIILNTKTWLLFVLLFGISFSAWAQSDDFNTWTKFKVNHKIDSRFSVSGDLELRMKDDVSKLDRWGLTVGGSYRPYSFWIWGWLWNPSSEFGWLGLEVQASLSYNCYCQFSLSMVESSCKGKISADFWSWQLWNSFAFPLEIILCSYKRNCFPISLLKSIRVWMTFLLESRSYALSSRSRNSFGQTLVVGCILLLSICIFARQTHCRNRSGIFFLKLAGS